MHLEGSPAGRRRCSAYGHSSALWWHIQRTRREQLWRRLLLITSEVQNPKFKQMDGKGTWDSERIIIFSFWGITLKLNKTNATQWHFLANSVKFLNCWLYFKRVYFDCNNTIMNYRITWKYDEWRVSLIQQKTKLKISAPVISFDFVRISELLGVLNFKYINSVFLISGTNSPSRC